MAEVKLTPSFPTFPEKTFPLTRPEPSYLETLEANTQQTFGPAIAGNLYYMRDPVKRDLGFNITKFLEKNNINPNSADGKYITNYGFNEQTATDALNHRKEMTEAQMTLEEAGFVKSILADSVLMAELITIGGTYSLLRSLSKKQASKFLGEQFLSPEDIRRIRKYEAEKKSSVLEPNDLDSPEAIENAKKATTALLNETMAKKGFRIANSEALFFEGSYNAFTLGNDLSGDVDADQAVKDALLRQVIAQGVSSVIGYGLGKTIDLQQPKQAQAIANSFKETMKSFDDLANGVNAKPPQKVVTTTPLPSVKTDDLLFEGEWWTNSIFYRALPTPVKSIMGNNSGATKNVKLRFMRLVNDGGVLFKLNQLGKSFGISVFQEAGALSGRWGNVYNQIHEIWGEVSPQGNYQIADMQISNTVAKIQKFRGKENLTFEDFGQHITDLYIHNKTPTTDAEKKAVQILKDYFDEWDKLLNEVGLLGGTASLVKRKGNVETRIGELENTFNDIILSNRNFLEDEIAKKTAKIEPLDIQFKTRGLTDKQLPFRNSLRKEIDDLSTALEASYRIKNIPTALKYLDNLRLSDPQKKALKNIEKHRNEMKDRLDNLNSYLDGTAVEKGLKENFFPRYFDKRKILANREEFEQRLINHYGKQPTVWDWDSKTKRYIQVKLDTDPDAIARRAKRTTDEILELVDDDGFIDGYFGKGRSKHLMHRSLDIPNSEVSDFMITDLKQILIAYNEKIAPKYAFAKQFRTENGLPATIDDILFTNTKEMRGAGVSQTEIDRVNKEFVGAYDRIVGRVLTKPDSASTRLAQWLQTATQWTYLGGAGIAAIADFANIFLDHEMRTIFKGLISLADDNSLKIQKKELQKAGDGFELIGGSYHMKFMESLSNNPFRTGATDRINDAFYKFNLLGQMTMTAKTFEGMFRTHSIIDMTQKLARGDTLTKFESQFLARYNINKRMAKRIAKQPVETTKNGFILANTDAWTDQGALEAFQTALRSGVMNRIIMGTPADKPLAMSGKTYLPMSLAKEFGLKESKRVRGYAELEHPFLALPFTFYTYTVGALNKVTTNYAQGGVRGINMAVHSAVAMFFGYNIVKFRTPDYAWNEMDIEDKILRSFDFSGLAAFHSDMLYRSFEMGMAFDIENPTPFEPKFKEDPDALGGVVSIFGAPADYSYGFVKTLQDFARGNYGEGTEQAVKQIPLIWNMFLKPYTNRLKNALGDFAEGFE